MSIASNISQIEKRITEACKRANRNRSEVTLIAVSKLKSAADIDEAYRAGLKNFGENYVQEYLEKKTILPKDIQWHLIGQLQSNKLNKILAAGDCTIHSVDSITLLEKLSTKLRALGSEKKQKIFIEVRLGDEISAKTGVLENNLPKTLDYALQCQHIQVEGLMLIPPYFDDIEKSRPYFKKLKELFNQENARTNATLRYLSMGMSQDFEIAIEEGATHIRVGTAIFGNRS